MSFLALDGTVESKEFCVNISFILIERHVKKLVVSYNDLLKLL